MNDKKIIEFDDFEVIQLRVMVKIEIERLKRVMEMFADDKGICKLQEKNLEECNAILAKLS